jgi:hypothetical protein
LAPEPFGGTSADGKSNRTTVSCSPLPARPVDDVSKPSPDLFRLSLIDRHVIAIALHRICPAPAKLVVQRPEISLQLLIRIELMRGLSIERVPDAVTGFG